MYGLNKILLLLQFKKSSSNYRVIFSLGENQIKHLLKIAAFSKDKSLKETSQAEMKEQCLKLWKVIFLCV